MSNAINASKTIKVLNDICSSQPFVTSFMARMLSNQYWISIFPGIALLVLVLSINLVGDRLRDILNPRLER